MEDALKKIGAELATELATKFESEEFKAFIESTKAASDAESGTFEVVITTENLDRYQEVIKLDGWELEHYRKNPVVLWGHDHSQPIGMATSVDIVDGKMIAKGKFAPTEKAQEIRKLYDFGIIKATSVGFIEKEREGNLITKAELLEFSFVSVPANPFALRLSMEKGVSVNDLVTKGLMHVEKAEGGDAPDDAATDAAPTLEEKAFSTKQLAPVIDSLKAAIVALEALGSDTKEPEGDDEPDDDAISEDEQKGFLAYRENRKLLQSVSTILGDALAEARSIAEAGRK